MMYPDRCHHDKTWEEECPQCGVEWEDDMLRSTIKRIEKAAAFYENNRGLTGDPRVVPDIYRAMSGLVKIIGAKSHKKDG